MTTLKKFLFGMLICLVLATPVLAGRSVLYGQIGEHDVMLRFQRVGDDLYGTYAILENKPGFLHNGVVLLKGKLKDANEFEMREKYGEKVTGIFEGTMDEAVPLALKGTWKGDKKRQLSFSLSEALPSQKEKPSFTMKRGRPGRMFPQIDSPATPAEKEFNEAVKHTLENVQGESVEAEIPFANASLVSVALFSTYTGGFSSTNIVPINFDLRGNKLLRLSDLFKEGSDYRRKIENIYSGLPRDEADELEMENNKQFEVWYLMPKGIVFVIEAPMESNLEMFIPYSVFKDDIDPPGPLSGFRDQ